MTTSLPTPANTLTLTETDGIRRFTSAAIQSAIDDALSSLPADRRVAVVAHADLEGTSLSLVCRLGPAWSVSAAAYKPYHGAMEAEAKVVWSPF